jgi:methylmalonyl-CoA mutase cobalamin-binding subunit
MEAERVARTLALERVDVLGVTVSEERELLPVHRLISHCRSVSRNSALIVVVGGTQAFLRKELAKEVNADLVATQVSTARLQLLTLLQERQAESPPG